MSEMAEHEARLIQEAEEFARQQDQEMDKLAKVVNEMKETIVAVVKNTDRQALLDSEDLFHDLYSNLLIQLDSSNKYVVNNAKYVLSMLLILLGALKL